MKKQPIDDLFARKLRDLNVPVGPAVYGRLQSRLGATATPARRAVWWYVAAAACFVLMLGGVYWVRLGADAPGTLPTLAKQSARQHARQKVAQPAPAYVPASEQLATNRVADRKQSLRFRAAQSIGRLAVTASSVALTVDRHAHSETVQERLNTKGAVAPDVRPVVGLSALKTVSPTTDTAPLPAERIVQMILHEPADEPTVAVPDAAPVAIQGTRLTSLLGKIRQLKSGEAYAKATPLPGEPRTRLGRVLNNVKESLKNDNTL